MEITVSVKRNNVPTVVPCHWETFENARDKRIESRIMTIGAIEFINRTAERIKRGMARRNVHN